MAQNEPRGGRPLKDTRIYVTVDISKINEGNINQHVDFSDDRDDPPQVPGKPQDYVSTISKGMKVYWEGKAKDSGSGDTIQITAVKSKDGGDQWRLLDNVKSESGNTGIKVGKVKDREITDPEPYYVTFTINEASKEYTVDPKLQMEYQG